MDLGLLSVRAAGCPERRTRRQHRGRHHRTLFNDRILDWLYFDIQAQPGTTYDVLVSGGPNGSACLGAASFDSVSDVPEPSSFELAGLGAALLAIGSLLGGRVVRRFAVIAEPYPETRSGRSQTHVGFASRAFKAKLILVKK